MKAIGFPSLLIEVGFCQQTKSQGSESRGCKVNLRQLRSHVLNHKLAKPNLKDIPKVLFLSFKSLVLYKEV